MNYSLNHIARIIGAGNAVVADTVIEQLILDSRKVYSPSASLFFALKGPRRDGHQFIPELYKKGVMNFVVSETIDEANYPEAIFLLVGDTLAALQQLAIHHRRQFHIPVIGITGSNGKTIVKEWLYQLLHSDYNIIRSPKSYNSQIGVPLSIWPMNSQHTLGIFEAGISQPGEMQQLAAVIQPTIGILTNIGEAHGENFADAAIKLNEKVKLFTTAEIIIVHTDDLLIHELTKQYPDKYFTWGKKDECTVRVLSIVKNNFEAEATLQFKHTIFTFSLPFTDDASVENSICCCCTLLAMGYDPEVIKERIKQLQPVNMRLEMKKGINHCSIINDSYSADLSSLEIALNFLDQQSAGTKKTVILSDFLQSALPDEELYHHILSSLKKHQVARLIGIGERITDSLQSLLLNPEPGLAIELFPSTNDFIHQFRSSHFKEETILIKGARVFSFEQIVQLLEQKVHQTVMEINLNAIIHNLKEYQKFLRPSTKVMAMVKAFAYGSGGAEIAGILQYHKVDYLGVAYADEGVELRKAGIHLPVMVMNPEENAFESIIEYNLQPEIFSFDLLHSFDLFLKKEGLQQYSVHIEIETGMNRLGFAADEVEKLSEALLSTASFKVQTVFSHLVASEEASEDKFTMGQHQKFEVAAKLLEEKLGYSFICHIANSAAAIRLPPLQMDMVRLGIGLYGVDSVHTHKLNLETVTTLKSTIAQIKHLHAGESVSYNRKGIINRESTIATIRIGYADGYPRRLGNGVGKVWVKGNRVPVIGTVCMDMIMIDITGISNVQEGDEVIIFGAALPVQQIAEWAATIPYEIMTGISQRVKRVYFEE